MPAPFDEVTITGAAKESNHSGNIWSVPRRDLIGTPQILLEQDELKIAKNMRDAPALTRELLSMRTDRHETKEHDDLVFALARVCWRAKRRPKMNAFGTQRIPGI